jgi:hypothetical protein
MEGSEFAFALDWCLEDARKNYDYEYLKERSALGSIRTKAVKQKSNRMASFLDKLRRRLKGQTENKRG